MIYRSIELENYRNYEKRAFTFNEKANILVGENGRGKTNLIESIYITSFGKSFRTQSDKELIRFGKDFFRVKGKFLREVTGEEENEIEISFSKEGKRKGSINGVPFTKFSDIFDNALAVIFSPEDLKIVKEGPEKRRKFIDDEQSQLSLSYYRNLINYRKVLLQRNAYLKEDNRDSKMLSVWDENLAEYGSNITLQRYLFIKKIERLSKEIHKKLSGEKEEIKLDYDSNVVEKEIQKEVFGEKESMERGEKSKAIEKIKELFYERLREERERDLQTRFSNAGPQKDDIKICINDIDARHFGSQGQQRTAALAIKLSEIELIKEEKGEYPVLLLDDVLSELDAQRQSFLLDAVEGVQLFITTTDLLGEVEENLPKGKIIEI